MDPQSFGRRSGPRSPISFPISFKTSDDIRERPARIRDMGAGGIAFFSEHDLHPAAKIEVVLLIPYEITLTQTLPVRMNAEVIRVDRIDHCDHLRSIAVALCPSSEAGGPLSSLPQDRHNSPN